MTNGRLLWVDDEIDLLRAHILFLEKKGYDISTASNGSDALELCEKEDFDLIFLDENMPGLSGLETLSQLKERGVNTPVVMVTKNEEENIMDQAIGAKIADYLIKPVNPNQILLARKPRRQATGRSFPKSISKCRKTLMRRAGKNSIKSWCTGSWNFHRPTAR